MFKLQDTEQDKVQNWNVVAGVKLHKYFYQKKKEYFPLFQKFPVVNTGMEKFRGREIGNASLYLIW